MGTLLGSTDFDAILLLYRYFMRKIVLPGTTEFVRYTVEW